MEDMNFTMYECMGQPVKEMMAIWLSAVRDPATDPKWRRKQRIKRFFIRLVSGFKLASIVFVVGLIVSLVVKTVKGD